MTASGHITPMVRADNSGEGTERRAAPAVRSLLGFSFSFVKALRYTMPIRYSMKEIAEDNRAIASTTSGISRVEKSL